MKQSLLTRLQEGPVQDLKDAISESIQGEVKIDLERLTIYHRTMGKVDGQSKQFSHINDFLNYATGLCDGKAFDWAMVNAVKIQSAIKYS